jgi:hypothetical protein
VRGNTGREEKMREEEREGRKGKKTNLVDCSGVKPLLHPSPNDPVRSSKQPHVSFCRCPNSNRRERTRKWRKGNARKEPWRSKQVNRSQRFRVPRTREHRGALHVVFELPEPAEGDVGDVDDCGRRGEGEGRELR